MTFEEHRLALGKAIKELRQAMIEAFHNDVQMFLTFCSYIRRKIK